MKKLKLLNNNYINLKISVLLYKLMNNLEDLI